MSAQQTVMVDDLDSFVRILVGWHKAQVATLEHMKAIPDGTEVSDSDESKPPLVLTGPAREGFIFGIKTALEMLGTLPFEAEVEEVDEAEAEPKAEGQVPGESQEQGLQPAPVLN